jgi:hypothetical protein
VAPAGYQPGLAEQGPGQAGRPSAGYQVSQQNGQVGNGQSYQQGPGPSGAGQSAPGQNGPAQNVPGQSGTGYQLNYNPGAPGGMHTGQMPGSFPPGTIPPGTIPPGTIPPDGRARDPYSSGLAQLASVGFDGAPAPMQGKPGFGVPDPAFGQNQPGQQLGQPQQQASPGAGQMQAGQMQAGQAQPGQMQAVRMQQAVAIALPDAVKAAHAEGFTFGESVGRDAPGLWLEAVLARKPRMPSDLEARLLQGSVLPIDSLLHDEVRHSLRRGFWDALESARR